MAETGKRLHKVEVSDVEVAVEFIGGKHVTEG